MRPLLSRIAAWLYRPSDDSARRVDPRTNAAKAALFALGVAGIGVIVVPAFSRQIAAWNKMKTEFPVARADLKTLYSDSNCPATAGPGCPASPREPALWNSMTSPADKAHGARTLPERAQPLWVGATIPVETLRAA